MIIAVIPGYNEEENIVEVIKKTNKYVDYIVCVDDGSHDNTSLILKTPAIELLEQ